MRGILADNDVEGFVRGIHSIWLTDTWRELWQDLGLSVYSFQMLGLSRESTDAVVWRTCQREAVVLITGNRNEDRPESLEAVIRTENQPESLPVITLANLERLARDRGYAELVAERLLERLMAMDDLRGSGRIYVP